MAKKVTLSNMPDAEFIKNPQQLGQLIKAKRTALGMKLIDCASLCGIGVNTLSRLENGNANCTLSALFSVLNGLGIKVTTKELISHQPSDVKTNSQSKDISIDSEWI